jgi:hypothetical protein
LLLLDAPFPAESEDPAVPSALFRVLSSLDWPSAPLSSNDWIVASADSLLLAPEPSLLCALPTLLPPSPELLPVLSPLCELFPLSELFPSELFPLSELLPSELFPLSELSSLARAPMGHASAASAPATVHKSERRSMPASYRRGDARPCPRPATCRTRPHGGNALAVPPG